MRMYKAYDPRVLKKLQREELEVVKAFDALCSQQGWRYFLDFGALLGAVRHIGFIPWDDDIDVAMPRDDFEKMRSYVLKHMQDEDFLYGYKDQLSDPEFSKYVPLFYRKGTEFLNDRIGTPPGIGIDIFPFDYTSPNPRIQKWEIFRANLQRRLHYLCYRDPVIPFDGMLYGIVFLICKTARLGLRLLRIDPVKLFGSFEKANMRSHKRYQSSGLLTCYFDLAPQKNLMNIKQFETQEAPFEDAWLQLPADPDKLLKMLYGSDYMQLPPEDKRVNHSAERILFSDGELVDYFSKEQR
ncbi:MAG: LicD family protein [Firmicutes bacterium]|nr:LicD family protein [Bacillota bacterium]